ncbi:MAG: hypothetical protein WAO19_09130 [Candidatus Kryptoniota bacterium]
MIKILLFSIVVSALFSLILTPLVMRLAVFVGAVDKPEERKIHKRTMPRMGGVAVFLSFISTLVLLHFLLPQQKLDGILAEIGDPNYVGSWLLISVSFIAIIVLGVYDDIWTLKPGEKFLVQIMAGALVYLAGFSIKFITDPFSGGTFALGLFSLPLTVLWVVGITNAFNLIDGLDGLASGVALIASLTISSIALLHHDYTTAVIGIALAGAVIGFLRYNFNPARIFLGDSGSLFLGFTLAVLSIQSSTKGSTAFSVLVPLLALGVPIMDTSLAMLRRILRSFLPDQSLQSGFKKLHSMFLPDRRHIHHQLLAHGLSHRDAVIVLYIASCTFGLCAFLVTAGSLNASIVLIAFGIVGVIAVRKLGYREMAVFRNGLILRIYNRAFLKYTGAQIALDMLSVFVAIIFAGLLTTSTESAFAAWREWMFAAIIISIVQLLAFVLGGLYKRTVGLFGVGDLLQILKATLIGAAATVGALQLLMLIPFLHPANGSGPLMSSFIVMDFYFMVTLVIGSRVALHAMNYVVRRESIGGKKALIYGADNKGMIALQTLLSEPMVSGNGNDRKMMPIGFLDDDPDMEGKLLNGYPVFGGHWKLERLVNKMNVGEIILTNTNINPIAFDRVREISARCNVQIKVSHTVFKEISYTGSVGTSSKRPLEMNIDLPQMVA